MDNTQVYYYLASALLGILFLPLLPAIIAGRAGGKEKKLEQPLKAAQKAPPATPKNTPTPTPATKPVAIGTNKDKEKSMSAPTSRSVPPVAQAPVSTAPVSSSSESTGTNKKSEVPKPVEAKKVSDDSVDKKNNDPAKKKKKKKSAKSGTSTPTAKPSDAETSSKEVGDDDEATDDSGILSEDEDDSIADLLLLQSLSSKSNIKKKAKAAASQPKPKPLAKPVERRPSESDLAAKSVAAGEVAKSGTTVASTDAVEVSVPLSVVANSSLSSSKAVVAAQKPSFAENNTRSISPTKADSDAPKQKSTVAVPAKSPSMVATDASQSLVALQSQLKAANDKLSAETAKAEKLNFTIESLKATLTRLESEKTQIADSNRSLASYAQSATARLADAESRSNAAIGRIQSMFDAKVEEANRLAGILQGIESRLESERKALNERHALEVIGLQERIASISATADDKVNHISAIYEERIAQLKLEADAQLKMSVKKAVDQTKVECENIRLKELERKQMESSATTTKLTHELEEIVGVREKLTKDLKVAKDALAKEVKVVEGLNNTLKQKETELEDLKKKQKASKASEGGSFANEASVAAFEVAAGHQLAIASLAAKLESSMLAADAAAKKAIASKPEPTKQTHPPKSTPTATTSPAVDIQNAEVIAGQRAVISSLAGAIEGFALQQQTQASVAKPVQVVKEVKEISNHNEEDLATIKRLSHELRNCKEIRAREAIISALQGQMILERDRALDALKQQVAKKAAPPAPSTSSTSNASAIAAAEALAGSYSVINSLSTKVEGLIKATAAVTDKKVTALPGATPVAKAAPKPEPTSPKPAESNQAELIAASEALSGYASAVNSLASRVEGLESSLATSNSTVGTLTTQVKDLEKSLDRSDKALNIAKSALKALQDKSKSEKSSQPLVKSLPTATAPAPVPAAKTITPSPLATPPATPELPAGLKGPGVARLAMKSLSSPPKDTATIAVEAKKSTPAPTATQNKPSSTSTSSTAIPHDAYEVAAASSAVINRLASEIEMLHLSNATKQKDTSSASAKPVKNNNNNNSSNAKDNEKAIALAEAIAAQSSVITSLAASLEGQILTAEHALKNKSASPAKGGKDSSPDAQKKLEAIKAVLEKNELPGVGPGPFAGSKAVRRLEKQVSEVEVLRGSNWKLA
jgi:uncharacterized coiled-coil protein SlyX